MVRSFKGDLLGFEYDRKKKELQKTKKKLLKQISRIIAVVTYLDWVIVRKKCEEMLASYKSKVVATQKKSLQNLESTLTNPKE